MTKKQFIWLIIRFVGILKLIFSFGTILLGIPALLMIFSSYSATGTPERLITITLFGELLRSAWQILVVVYLVFFGKTIFNIIHRTAAGSLDVTSEEQNYVEILIRFVGFWWLWKFAVQIFGFITTAIWQAVLSHSEWFLSNEPGNQEIKEALDRFLDSFQQGMIWYILLKLLLYMALAWYFLKHGKFFINLLNRLWLKAAGNDLNQNPVISA